MSAYQVQIFILLVIRWKSYNCCSQFETTYISCISDVTNILNALFPQQNLSRRMCISSFRTSLWGIFYLVGLDYQREASSKWSWVSVAFASTFVVFLHVVWNAGAMAASPLGWGFLWGGTASYYSRLHTSICRPCPVIDLILIFRCEMKQATFSSLGSLIEKIHQDRRIAE